MTATATASKSARAKSPSPGNRRRKPHPRGCDCVECLAHAAADGGMVAFTYGHGVRPQQARPRVPMAPTQQWGPEDKWAAAIAANEASVRNDARIKGGERIARLIARGSKRPDVVNLASRAGDAMAHSFALQAEFAAQEADDVAKIAEVLSRTTTYENFASSETVVSDHLAVYTEGYGFDEAAAAATSKSPLERLREIGLTDREIGVLARTHNGESQRAAAAALGISKTWVAIVLSSALNKITKAGLTLKQIVSPTGDEKPKTVAFDPADLDRMLVDGTAKLATFDDYERRN